MLHPLMTDATASSASWWTSTTVVSFGAAVLGAVIASVTTHLSLWRARRVEYGAALASEGARALLGVRLSDWRSCTVSQIDDLLDVLLRTQLFAAELGDEDLGDFLFTLRMAVIWAAPDVNGSASSAPAWSAETLSEESRAQLSQVWPVVQGALLQAQARFADRLTRGRRKRVLQWYDEASRLGWTSGAHDYYPDLERLILESLHRLGEGPRLRLSA